jgi:hypothetical protein
MLMLLLQRNNFGKFPLLIEFPCFSEQECQFPLRGAGDYMEPPINKHTRSPYGLDQHDHQTLQGNRL